VTMLDRIAAAPISWGVCEVPGWGFQMTPARVLEEMRELGIAATEAGPDGYLGDDPDAAAALVREYGLRLIGGFVPTVLHRPGALEPVERAAALFAAAGADVLVVAAATGVEGYDSKPSLSESEWTTLLSGLDAAREICADRGLRCALHPHVGTMVEGPAEIAAVLERSTVELCLDTGHLVIGGNDPVELARGAAERVSHVHVKDVDGPLAARVLSGELTYSDAVRLGLYVPLGAGSVDVGEFVAVLESAGYAGWYVLEQDAMLAADPPADAGPVGDVRQSLEFLRSVALTRPTTA
jgi:inosose dehydratase